MEQALLDLFNAVIAKFPIVASIYVILTACYGVFCAIAAFTKTDRDDKIADKIRVFFSLPVKKK